MPEVEPEEPSGDLASPPPVNYEIFGRHAAVIEENFSRDPRFNLILFIMDCVDTEESLAEVADLLVSIEASEHPVDLIRAYISNQFSE